MTTCPTCGQPVRVHQSSEGTGCFVPVESEAIRKHRDKGNSEYSKLFAWCIENLKGFPPIEGEWIEDVKDRLLSGQSHLQMLSNLLARIHRDGGQYIQRHGLQNAADDAEAKVVQWISEQANRPESEAERVLREWGESVGIDPAKDFDMDRYVRAGETMHRLAIKLAGETMGGGG